MKSSSFGYKGFKLHMRQKEILWALQPTTIITDSAHRFGDKFRVGTCQDQCFSAIPLQHYNLLLYLFFAFQHVSLPGEPDSDY